MDEIAELRDALDRLHAVLEDLVVRGLRAAGAQDLARLAALRDDPDLRAALARSGLETILARHTCAHRVDELLAILDRLDAPSLSAARSTAA